VENAKIDSLLLKITYWGWIKPLVSTYPISNIAQSVISKITTPTSNLVLDATLDSNQSRKLKMIDTPSFLANHRFLAANSTASVNPCLFA